VRTLRDGTLPGRFDTLARLAADWNEPVAVRAEAVVGLAADAEARRATLLSLEEGDDQALRHEALRSLRGVNLTPEEQARVAKAGAGDDETAPLLALLAGPKADATSPASEPLAAWLARLEGAADPAAGERVFFHPKGPGCFRCHQIDGRGGRVGPDLSTTPAALTRERLVESVVDPSKEVAPQFVAWLVARKDGTVFTGTLLDESSAGVQTYADAQGRLITVAAGDVDDRRPQAASIMPADLARLMTPREFRDLVAFLRGRPAGR
jgi:putative heme-binding domain-containing protein